MIWSLVIAHNYTYLYILSSIQICSSTLLSCLIWYNMFKAYFCAECIIAFQPGTFNFFCEYYAHAWLFLIFNFSSVCVNKLLALSVEFLFYPWLSSENDLLISNVFEASSFICTITCGRCLSVSDQLSRRRFSNEWIPFEGGKPPRVPVNSTQNFMVIYCHVTLWPIKARSIGCLAGFDPSICSHPLWNLSYHVSVTCCCCCCSKLSIN